MVSVSPNGLVAYISRLWCGNVSNRYIVENDGFLPKLVPTDIIIADRGFTVQDILPVGVELNMPPRIPGHRQMTSKDYKTQGIASVRIVVEMKMEQLKN